MVFRLLASVIAASALACGGPPPCEDADACAFEAMVDAAEADDLAGAEAALSRIVSPELKVLATDKLLVTRPSGLDGAKALALCAALDPPASTRCAQNHERPHLWDD